MQACNGMHLVIDVILFAFVRIFNIKLSKKTSLIKTAQRNNNKQVLLYGRCIKKNPPKKNDLKSLKKIWNMGDFFPARSNQRWVVCVPCELPRSGSCGQEKGSCALSQ